MRRRVFNLRAMARILRSAVASRLTPAVSPSTRFEFDLLSLPEELICLVIDHVDQMKSLERLSRTSRQCQRLAEPKLYRHHTLRCESECDMLLYSLDARPPRASYIHTLNYLMNADNDQSFDCLQELLARCNHLKEFSFESPECNTSDFEDEEDWMAMTDHLFQPFQEAAITLIPSLEVDLKPLQFLSKLTLHMNGIEAPYWNFDARSKTILLLPMLSYLKISCVNILDDLAEGIDRVSFSPLKHLELEECNFTHKGLHHILSFPKALESLDLLENCHNINQFPEALHPAWNQLFKHNPAATLAALSQQKNSLKSLTYATTEDGYEWYSISTFIWPDKAPIDGGFADFFALEKIKLIGECANFERAVLSSRAPPNLKVLAVDSDYPLEKFHYNFQPVVDTVSQHAFEFAPFFRAPSSCMPKRFEKLELTHTSHPEEDQELILNLAKELGAVGAKLTVSIKEETSYFPPYLDGEEIPGEEVYFDGEVIVS